MWIMLSDCFLSIVSKDCARDELLVRARRKGDIEKIFPGAAVRRGGGSDYMYRSIIKKKAVAEAMVGEVNRITYPNFKNSVYDEDLHLAYMNIWLTMSRLQPDQPVAGGQYGLFPAPKPKRKKRRK